MHITIPSSSRSGEESYTKSLFPPRGHTDSSYSQIKGLPNIPSLTKELQQLLRPKEHTLNRMLLSPPVCFRHRGLEVKPDSALLAPCDPL